MIIILAARGLNIYLCSKIANISRYDNVINNKNQFFLWFSGVRGSMAFALSIKSRDDFPRSGPIFLLLTLMFSLLTILYSSFFMDYTLRKCEITNICEADNFEESKLKHKSCFEAFKTFIEEYNQKYLEKCVYRENRYENAPIQLQTLRDDGKRPSIQLKPDINNEIQGDAKEEGLCEKRNSDETSDKKIPAIKNMHLFE